MTTNKNILVLEVPSEAGTHNHGQSLAPRAIHDAGLQDKLHALNYRTITIDALADSELPTTWQRSDLENGVRNEDAVLKVMLQVQSCLTSNLADYVLDEEERGEAIGRTDADIKTSPIPNAMPFPLVLGGDCSITPAVLAALSKTYEGRKVGLLYVDNDADLTLPTETLAPGSTGMLDSMVLTHLTHRLDGLHSMRQFASPTGGPLIDPSNIVLVGLDPTQPKPSHFAYLLDYHYRVLTNRAVKADPSAAMNEALRYLLDRCDVVLLHFDVDVVDSAHWPLGNYPSYGGLTFDEVMESVKLALREPRVVGLVITEINPNNDPEKKMVRELVDELVAGFETRAGDEII